MGEKVRILCVDDEKNILRALKRLFLEEDYIIITATSAEEGLRVLEQEDIQVVLSDYRMPVMNGVEFLNRVYKLWPQTVRLVLSGYADTAAVVGAVNEGHIYKFIPKPWNDNELKTTVENAIERYYLYKKNAELTTELFAKNEELVRLNSELQGLLKEKNISLEVRSRGLFAHQKIMDALPVGVAGLDFNDDVTFCNAAWLTAFGAMVSLDTKDAEAEELISLIKGIKTGQRSEKMLIRNGVRGRLTGSIWDNEGKAHGVILVFIPEPEGV